MKLIRKYNPGAALLAAMLAILPAVSMPAPVWASFTAGTIWRVNASGSDTLNGGGFDPTSANFATDLAATSATGTAPVVTSASYNFTARDNGAWLFIQGGTNWTPGWYQIASTNANAATLTATIGSAVLWKGSSALSTAAGCATTASPTSGTWSIDYSWSTSAGITFTDLAVGGTNTQFTSAANPVGKNFVGNNLRVTSGTGFTVQTVQIVSTSGTTATVDKTLGGTSLSGGNGGLGGALASPGQAAALLVAQNSVLIKAGTYNIANGSANTSGNAISVAQQALLWQGYGTLPGDGGTKPILKSTSNSITILTTGNINWGIENIEFQVGTATGVRPVYLTSTRAMMRGCKVTGAGSQAGIMIDGTINVVMDTEVTGTSGSLPGILASSATGFKGLRIYSHGNGGAGVSDTNSYAQYDWLICSGNGAGNTAGGMLINSNATIVRNCVFYGNTGPGIAITGGNQGISVEDSIAEGNSTYGFEWTTTYDAATGPYSVNNSSYNNTTAAEHGVPRVKVNFQALSGSPFSAAGSADFTLNNTSGAGRSVKAQTYTMPGLSGTGYLDAGAYGTSTTGGGSSGGKKAGPGGGKVGMIFPPLRMYRKAG